MPTFSTEQQQQLLYYGKNALLDLDVPPRKIIHRLGLTIYVPDEDQDQEPKFNEEEKEIDEEEEGEEEEEEEEVDTYSCDEFRMYEFKVRRCMRGRSHDWTDCPFAHPGEKARRRDPRRYHYSGVICLDFRQSGACPRGDFCEFAHGVFECWLHPARYRTMPCKDGRRCRRKVCFFAHAPSQLRRLPSATTTTPIPSPRSPRKPSCCAVWTAASSPTSPLMGFSSPISPPISPAGGAFQLSNHTAPGNPGNTGNNKNKNSTSSSGSYKGHGWLSSSGAMGYDSVLYEELMSSFEAMEISGDAAAAAASGIDGNIRRSSSSFSPIEERDSAEQQNSGGPDLEWVNELLM